MTDTITLTGLVATAPRHLITGEGLSITSFRLASPQRRYDRSRGAWVDADTNWYTITTFRQLAINLAGSLVKGDRIITTGRLRIRDWQKDDRAGTNVEVDADAVGHDLNWGTSSFSRTIVTARVLADAAAEAETFPSVREGGATQGTAHDDGSETEDDSETDDSDGSDTDSFESEGARGVGIEELAVPF